MFSNNLDHNRSVHLQLVSDEDRTTFWKNYAKYHNDMFNREKKRYLTAISHIDITDSFYGRNQLDGASETTSMG